MDFLGNLASINVGTILTILIGFLLVIPALTLHEWAHAWMANRLGDSTARMMGRISLNPVRHIDPVGTVLVPLFLLVTSVLFTGVPFTFGWAKPVPFNPRNLKDPKRDTALVGIAGPAMNVLLAAGASAILLALVLFVPSLVLDTSAQTSWGAPLLTGLGAVIGMFAYVNLILCFFNLLPIPPFDGSRIVQKFLTGNARHTYAQLEQYGMFIVLGLIFIPRMMGFDLIGMYFAVTAQPIFRLLTTIDAQTLFISLHILVGG
ncbi:MAG: site-2 protease family protein [Coriobacteriia bacterium]|nr:site-2 protease family protein [Coriobacteriia bacterium]